MTDSDGRLQVDLVWFDFDRDKVLAEIRAAGQTDMPAWERMARTGVYDFGEF